MWGAGCWGRDVLMVSRWVDRRKSWLCACGVAGCGDSHTSLLCDGVALVHRVVFS